jgi:hypothetical protein
MNLMYGSLNGNALGQYAGHLSVHSGVGIVNIIGGLNMMDAPNLQLTKSKSPRNALCRVDPTLQWKGDRGLEMYEYVQCTVTYINAANPVKRDGETNGPENWILEGASIQLPNID